jgi:hypothetical protein
MKRNLRSSHADSFSRSCFFLQNLRRRSIVPTCYFSTEKSWNQVPLSQQKGAREKWLHTNTMAVGISFWMKSEFKLKSLLILWNHLLHFYQELALPSQIMSRQPISIISIIIHGVNQVMLTWTLITKGKETCKFQNKHLVDSANHMALRSVN